MRSGTGYWSPTMLRSIRVQGCRGRRHAASAGSCRFVPAIWHPVRYCSFSGRLRSGRQCLFFGDACNALGQIHDATALFQAEVPNRKKASRGAVAIQLGLPRPAFSMVRAVFFRLSSAMSIRRFFSSKGLIDSIFFSKSFVSISSSLGSLFIVFSHSVNNLCSCGILFLSLLEINRPIYVSFSSDSC